MQLRFKKSRFVPIEIARKEIGIEAVLRCYQWKSLGSTTGDWNETESRLSDLANSLRSAVETNNEPSALQACEAILTWGGNRDFAVGAFPFLKRLTSGSPPHLCNYIRTVGKAFELRTADTSAVAPPVQLMNSMLTKVHALYALDGLPIYDSRVAAAIATLIEMWRIQSAQENSPLNPLLTFPATATTRTVLRFSPEAQQPGVMHYGDPSQTEIWSGAKIRLGWLMRAVLQRFPSLFSFREALNSRMHAFEAGLFVLGYDVACLAPNDGSQTAQVSYRRRVRKLMRSQDEIDVGAEETIVTTLSGRTDTQKIRYYGSVESGFNVIWGTLPPFSLTGEQITEIRAEFGNRKSVPLGANRDGSSADSLGTWLCENGWPSAQYASAIAPILLHEGVIEAYSGKRPILLDFK